MDRYIVKGGTIMSKLSKEDIFWGFPESFLVYENPNKYWTLMKFSYEKLKNWKLYSNKPK
jgi:hypothetical protein